MKEIDEGIVAYRVALTREADVGRSELAEIEDHLRALTRALVDDGMPAAQAVTEAARRLGEPRTLARELAAVRPPWGAKLSRARAWSAVALLLPSLYTTWHITGDLNTPYFDIGLSVALIVMLALRQSWARATVLGVCASILVLDVAMIYATSADADTLERALCYAGVIAFLVPWRRGELTGAGAALALLGPAYVGVGLLAQVYWYWNSSLPWPTLALPCVLLAGIGALTRGRWAVVPAALGSLVLVGATAELLVITSGFETFSSVLYVLDAWALLATVSFVAATALLYRHSRSTIGSVRAVLSLRA